MFALAQGIPVVALVKSPYYVNKMAGLRDQFGIGCELVRLDEGNVPGRIRAAIDRAWAEAERVRVPLLQAAAEQIERGRRRTLGFSSSCRRPAAIAPSMVSTQGLGVRLEKASRTPGVKTS